MFLTFPCVVLCGVQPVCNDMPSLPSSCLSSKGPGMGSYVGSMYCTGSGLLHILEVLLVPVGTWSLLRPKACQIVKMNGLGDCRHYNPNPCAAPEISVLGSYLNQPEPTIL